MWTSICLRCRLTCQCSALRPWSRSPTCRWPRSSSNRKWSPCCTTTACTTPHLVRSLSCSAAKPRVPLLRPTTPHTSLTWKPTPTSPSARRRWNRSDTPLSADVPSNSFKAHLNWCHTCWWIGESDPDCRDGGGEGRNGPRRSQHGGLHPGVGGMLRTGKNKWLR